MERVGVGKKVGKAVRPMSPSSRPVSAVGGGEAGQVEFASFLAARLSRFFLPQMLPNGLT